MPVINPESMTPANNSVTGAYCDGIKDGRQLLKSNPDMTYQEMQREKENSQKLMVKHDHVMKKYFMGNRDFWANQLKKI